MFRFDFGEAHSQFLVFPGLTDSGKVRVNPNRCFRATPVDPALQLIRAAQLLPSAKRFQKLEIVRLSGANRVTKTHAQPGSCSVVAANEPRWRTTVPAVVKREIPIELAPELNIVGRVQTELNAAGLRNGRQQIGTDGQGRLVEVEQLELGSDQASCYLLRWSGKNGLLIVDLLPSKTTINCEVGAAIVDDISPDPSAESALQLNALN